jgi:GntR family transcriptional regulator, transcriptional repressor for pyruvate dehydrogenase complex
MIQAQTMAARIAFRRNTILHLTELHDSVERACGFESRSQSYREAAAHAEILSLLADMVDDLVLTGGTAHVQDVMPAVGRAADGMIVSSRLRLLAHLRAGDGEGAALEMERHLQALLYVWRIALPGSQAIAGEVVA